MRIPVLLFLVPASAVAQAPERVAPDVLATPRHETFPSIDPRTGDLWFSVYDRSFDAQTIMVARKAGETWATAMVAPFSGTHGDRAPRFSPDGGRLYFTSNRPAPDRPVGDLNIWVVDRTETGWSPPRLAEALSTPQRDMHNAPVANGAHYVASYREGGLGRADIWRVAADGMAYPLGPPINDAGGQPDLWVSPDGTWMVLVVTEPEGGMGGDDLLVSEFRNGAWTAPRLLPARINSEEYEYGPWVADGWLYFTSHRGGNALARPADGRAGVLTAGRTASILGQAGCSPAPRHGPRDQAASRSTVSPLTNQERPNAQSAGDSSQNTGLRSATAVSRNSP